MNWWYEVRDADDRLIEVKRGFQTQAEAENAGRTAMRIIRDISPDRVLRVITGSDSARPN